MACAPPMTATSNGAFQGDNPLHFALPLLIVQICLVTFLTRAIAFLLRPLRQPRVIAEIVGGIILGPSVLGRSTTYLNAVFPKSSLTLLDTLANMGLMLFLFLVGLELDLKALRRTGKKAIAIALVGISLPFGLGIGSSFVLRSTVSKGVDTTSFLVFMGVAMSITAFPVLARILAELKLLTTEVGRMAMSAAAVNDVAAWILLALAIALSGSKHSYIVPLWVLLSACAFVVCSILVIPPIFTMMSQRCQEGEPIDELYVCATLAIVLVGGFITDAIGIHAMFGAFVIGVLVPKEGSFANSIVEKVEDLISGLFLPLFFVSSGLKTNVATIQGLQSWGLLVLVILTACLGKIVGTFTVSMLCRVPLHESLALGILMNTKGLVELIVLNIGKDRKVLNDQTFAIMVLMAIFTTFITTPLVVAVYKPARRRKAAADYKYKTVERKNSKSQLRVLACFHSSRNVPSIINLLEASRGSSSENAEGLCVYAMHLMELSERSSAILMVHKARQNGVPFWNKVRGSDPNHVVVAFEAFRQLSRVSVRPMTAISSMSSMHEDICSTAERKRAAIIILPYHKLQRLDGSLDISRNDICGVNNRVLEQAPCSVGILIDRGLGGNIHVSASRVAYTIVVPFFGGPDDNEALSYGVRMAEHPGIYLMIIRFLLKPENPGEIVHEPPHDLLSEFNLNDSKSVACEDNYVASAAEAIAVIRGISNCNLFLVGRRSQCEMAFASTERSECPELGPVGSALASSDFSGMSSVLVVQQYSSCQSSVLASQTGEELQSLDLESSKVDITR